MIIKLKNLNLIRNLFQNLIIINLVLIKILKLKKKINTNNQTGGFANIEPTEKTYKSLQIGTDNINNKLSLYQLNGFPGSPPKPECTIM